MHRAARVLVTALAVLLPRASEAQLFRLTPNGGELGVESRGVRSQADGDPSSWESFLATWVNLPVSGSVLSPRFLSYSAAVRPTRLQQTLRAGDGRFELHTLGLSLGATLFAAAPVSLSVHSVRTDAASPSEAPGAATAYRNGTSGALLRVRWPAFPLRVEWSARDQADEWRAAFGVPGIRRDESLDVVRIAGESSKLSTMLERQRFVDRIGTLDFTSTAGSVLHTLRWGTGSSLTSTAEAHRREGREAQERRLIGEHLHLRHSRTVASDLSIHRQRAQSGGTYRSDVSTTALSVHADPAPGLSGAIASSYTATTLTNGRLRMVGAAPSVSLRRELPAGVRFAGQVGLNYQRTDQYLRDAIATPISDELHVVDATRQFGIPNERVDPASIVVYDRDRTTVYLVGTDYRVVALGSTLRLEIPIVSRIQVGDELRLSYLFAAPDARAHDLHGVHAMFSFGRGGLAISQSALLRRTRVLAGDPNAGLEGGDDYVSGIDARRALGGGSLDLNLQHRMRRHARSDFTATELRAGFQPRVSSSRQSRIGATFSRSGSGGQVATVLGASVSTALQFRPGWQLGTAAESQRWRLDDGATDRTNVASVDLAWRSGRLESEWRYVWQQRSTLEQRSQHRVFARLLRRF